MTIDEFAEAAAQYCYMMRASVTSWGRSEKHNEQVGGVKNSAHRYFRGLDVVYDDPMLLAQDPSPRIETAARLGLKLIAEGDHDHLQPLDWRAG